MGEIWDHPIISRVVAVVVDLSNGKRQIGSGYLVGGRLVLTAEHCTRDKLATGPAETIVAMKVVRLSDFDEAPATVVHTDGQRAASAFLDLAVLAVNDDSWPDLPPISWARIERGHASELHPCDAIGFPLWQLDPNDHLRNAVNVKGLIRVLDDIGADPPHLVLRDPILQGVHIRSTPRSGGANEDDWTSRDPSPWGGQSGALVFHRGLAIGVVVMHNPQQGGTALQIRPLDIVATSQDSAARAIWKVLGLESADLPTLHPSELETDKGRGKREVGLRLAKAEDNFKDRLSEQARIESLLAKRSTRAVVVVGRPGIGKTELAGHVLENLLQSDPLINVANLAAKGRARISLSHIFIACRDLVGGDKGRHLDRIWSNTQITVEDKVTQLLEALQDRRVVIALDNFETLLTPTRTLADRELRTFVNQLLDGASEARLLITSRVPPVFDTSASNLVSPLVPLEQGLPEPDAIDLLKSFGEVVPELEMAPPEQLARLVHITGGVPRALELCASILAGPFPPTIDDMIEDFFATDKIVSELFQAAYDSLRPEEQIVLQSLSVFTRPVLPNAVDYLAPELDTKTILDSLVTRYLVSFDRETRSLSLHPLDQDYLYRQVLASGKENIQRLESLAADYWHTIRKPEETWQSLRDVEPQLQEYAHRKRAEEWDAAAEVLASLDTRYRVVTWDATHFLARRLDIGPHIVNPRLQLQNSFALGIIHFVLGPQEEALRHFEEVRKVAEEEDAELYRQSTGWVGVAYRGLGRLDRAARMVKTAAKLNGEAGDTWSQGWWMAELALIRAFQRRPHEAVKAGLLARKLAEELRSEELLGRAADVLGAAYFRLGRLDDAAREAATALEIDYRIKVPDIGAFTRNLQGMIALRRGNAIEAESAFRDVVRWGHDLSSQRVEGLGLLHWAIALRRQEDHVGAEEKASASLELLTTGGKAAAAPPRHLLTACRAHLQREPAVESRELIEYVRSATADADMYCTDDILDEAARLAVDVDDSELVADIDHLRLELNTFDR